MQALIRIDDVEYDELTLQVAPLEGQFLTLVRAKIKDGVASIQTIKTVVSRVEHLLRQERGACSHELIIYVKKLQEQIDTKDHGG
jgi:hypothetical protein